MRCIFFFFFLRHRKQATNIKSRSSVPRDTQHPQRGFRPWTVTAPTLPPVSGEDGGLDRRIRQPNPLAGASSTTPVRFGERARAREGLKQRNYKPGKEEKTSGTLEGSTVHRKENIYSFPPSPLKHMSLAKLAFGPRHCSQAMHCMRCRPSSATPVSVSEGAVHVEKNTRSGRTRREIERTKEQFARKRVARAWHVGHASDPSGAESSGLASKRKVRRATRWGSARQDRWLVNQDSNRATSKLGAAKGVAAFGACGSTDGGLSTRESHSAVTFTIRC